MWLTNRIFSLVWDIYDFFISSWLEVQGWPYPFRYLSGPLYSVAQACWSLLTPIANLGDWIDDVTTRVGRILSFGEIYLYFKDWFDRAEWAWEWITSAWFYVTGIISEWWTGAMDEVQGLIDSAISGVRTLIDQVIATTVELREDINQFIDRLPALNEISSWWSNWTGHVSAVLTTWWTGKVLEVHGLIDTAFLERASWWAGWSDSRSSVIEFFSDPLEYLWTRFTDWFLGPEE